MKISVSSTIKSATFLQKAKELSRKLRLPFCTDIANPETENVLCYFPEGLKLIQIDTTKNRIMDLLFVDFVHGKNGYRRKNNATIKQPLAKAVGIKAGYRPTILDATAGLGGDGFVLATLGCKVAMCERNPIMFELLHDGLNRALANSTTKSIVEDRVTLMKTDSAPHMTHSKGRFETVYLDPMYPHSTGSALNKKEMRIIRMLVGDDEDSNNLLTSAKAVATKRVVVKRPRRAPPLTGENVSYQIQTKSGRYDIYLIA